MFQQYIVPVSFLIGLGFGFILNRMMLIKNPALMNALIHKARQDMELADSILKQKLATIPQATIARDVTTALEVVAPAVPLVVSQAVGDFAASALHSVAKGGAQ